MIAIKATYDKAHHGQFLCPPTECVRGQLKLIKVSAALLKNCFRQSVLKAIARTPRLEGVTLAMTFKNSIHPGINFGPRNTAGHGMAKTILASSDCYKATSINFAQPLTHVPPPPTASLPTLSPIQLQFCHSRI